MIIAGLQKLTLLDYPQHLAATVFTRGCNMRCPYCYNVDLVLPVSASASESIDALGFLRTRTGILDGVCITGGEPTLQPDLADFCAAVREMGLLVKLDTNGTRPEVVAHLIENNLVNYLAMDIKNAFDAYPLTSGLCEPFASAEKARSLIDNVRTSMHIVAESGVDFEFRTTVARETHTLDSLREIATTIANVLQQAHDHHAAQKSTETDAAFKGWFLQRFDEHAPATVGKTVFHAWQPEDLERALDDLRGILPQTQLRGMD